MLAERGRRAETRQFGDPVHRLAGGLQQALGRRQPVVEHPLRHRGAGLGLETPREIAPAHAGAVGQQIQRKGLFQVFQRPVQRGAEPVRARDTGQRLLDVLGLPAIPVRRHHHAPRHAVGDLRPVVAAQQMQAAIDGGSRAGGRKDLAVVQVQGLAVQPDLGIAPCKIIAPGPMRGGGAPVQQAGFGQHERAQAQPGDPGAPAVAGAQRLQQGGRRGFFGVPPGRHDEGVGLFQRGKPVLHLDLEPRHGGNEPWRLGADQQAVARHAQPGQVVAEHLAGDGQVEGADALEGDDGDGMHGEPRRRCGTDQVRVGPILSVVVHRAAIAIAAVAGH
ncbi:hypothetical protein D9M68_421540 [compost metagenome]